MESKELIIPYKKDLKLVSVEEIDKAELIMKQETMQDDIDKFITEISYYIRDTARTKKEKFVLYNLQWIEDYTTNKENQDIIFKAIQDELNMKGYINYITKITLDGERLVILLDDSQRNKAEEEIRQMNKDNIKFALIIIFMLLLGIVSIITLFMFSKS